MTGDLVVRMYNVRFGDAILITFPDEDPASGRITTRRILIDVGNSATGTGKAGGGDDVVFEDVVGDILDQLDGEPLDLYVMTHEHLDHTQGLFYASTKLPNLHVAQRLKVRHAWLTASADPTYYDTHHEAAKQKKAAVEMYHRVAALMASRPSAATQTFAAMLANNNPNKTDECVAYLRTLNAEKTHYMHRTATLRDTHPFKEAKLSIWAPEEDTSEYYGAFRPLDAGAVPLRASAGRSRGTNRMPDPLPPAGVDAGAFLGLIEARRNGAADNLLTIDKAANNTSIVFALEWRGWRLLFAGDAEIRSWKTMSREGVLEPIHFLKVAHHGSHNGTPADGMFDAILPAEAPDDKGRHAAVSTWRDTYSGIPHTPTNNRIKKRATLNSTLDSPDQLFYEIAFAG